MSNLELKGGIMEMIARIDDFESLTKLKKMIGDFISKSANDSDFWDELNEIERKELQAAIDESEDESNHIRHEVVMAKYKKWIGK